MTLTERVKALEAEVKKLRDLFNKLSPAPAPAPPAPTPPPPAPTPAPPAPTPPASLPAPFLARPEISGSKDIGAGVLTRKMAVAQPGWTAVQGRWYVQGNPAEIGSQATRPSAGLKHGDMVLYRERFVNAQGVTAEVESLLFGPMKMPGFEFVVLGGTAQL